MPARMYTSKNTNEKTEDEKMLMEKQKCTVNQIMAALSKKYNVVTPVVIASIFAHDDGGKLLRRHLRAKFADNHNHGANWIWKTNDTTLKNVIEYAYNLWAVNDEWMKKCIVRNGETK